MKRFLAAAAIAAAFVTTAQAAEQEDRVRLAGAAETSAGSQAPATEVERSWPATAEIRIGDRCVESSGWIPNAYVGKRPAKLWECWGGDNQLFFLEEGVLYVGKDRAAQLSPLTADLWPGCETFTIDDGARPFEIKSCTSRSRSAQPEARVDIVEEGVSTISVVYPRGSKEVARGAALVIRAIDWRAPAEPLWEYLLSQQLRLIGTSLCLSVAPSGMERGAPLTLEACETADEAAQQRTKVRLVARPSAPND